MTKPLSVPPDALARAAMLMTPARPATDEDQTLERTSDDLTWTTCNNTSHDDGGPGHRVSTSVGAG